MLPEDDENNNHIEEQNESENETDVEDFLNKVEVIKKTEERKVFIIKHDNNSGDGEPAPASIANKFNWGAFLFNWIWGIRYRKWVLVAIPVLMVLPFGFLLGIPGCIWAGMNGNQWAWEVVEYKNEEDFHSAQKRWVKAWCILFSIFVLAALIIWAMIPKQKPAEVPKMNTDIENSPVTQQMFIPDEVFKNTTSEDKYSDILASDKFIVYWLRYKNDFEDSNLKYLQDKMIEQKDRINDGFVLYPELVEKRGEDGSIIKTDKNIEMKKDDIKPHCSNPNSTCIEKWLYENCYDRYCIINPGTGAYMKVSGKNNVIPQALNAVDSWNRYK